MSKENNVLTVLANNPTLLEAVKKVVLDRFAEVPYAEGASDELLGQITRARYVGRQRVEAAFLEISSFKSVKEKSAPENPAY